MVMVAVVIFAYEFESSGAVAEIEPLDHPHFFQEVHGTIDGGEVAIAVAFPHLNQDFAVGERMRMFPKDLQNRRARTRDFAGLTA
jgi:hypothetical protein